MTKKILCSSVLEILPQVQITEQKEIMLEDFRKVQNISKEIILNILKQNIKKNISKNKKIYFECVELETANKILQIIKL